IKAAPTPPIAKQELMNKAWDSSLVREMLKRTGEEGQAGIEAFRPEHLPKHYGMQPDGLYKPARVTAIITDELNASKLEFGEKDPRRSSIENNATDLETEDLITPQDM